MRTYAVAVGEIAGTLDVEAPHLAAAAGLAVFDVKTRLAGPLPRILFQSPSEDAARKVLAAVRARGHGCFLCDTGLVPRAAELVRVRRFAFDAEGLQADRASLRWDDIGVILRIAFRTPVNRTTREKELRPSGGRPAHTVEVEHTGHEQILSHVVYLVPRSRDTVRPRSWLLSEGETSFLALGTAMRPTARENFAIAVDLVRERAAAAIYDDRYLESPLAATHARNVRDSASVEAPQPDSAVDLAVYLLSEWLFAGAPYRS